MSIELIRKIKDLVIGGTNDEGWVYDKATTDSKLATKPTATLVTNISNSSTDSQVASAKAINTKLDGKADSTHNHDSEYYKQIEIDEMFSQMQEAQIDGEIDLSNYALKSHSHGNISNAGAIGSTANKPIITTTSGKLTTGSFEGTATNIKMNGTQSVGSLNTFARGDHVHPTDTSRAPASHTHTKANITDFPSTMTPSSHAHGDITNDGKLGSAANKPLITTTNGKIAVGSFGTGANTFCQGNDPRLSDARAPTSHAHGGITNAGAIGSTANLPIITGTNGVLKAGSFETTATNIKMNGTQSAGSLNTFARGDHVHPVDTSRAPNNHASTATTYGVASSSAYGHVKLDSSPTMNSSNVVSSGGMYTFLKWKTLNWGESGNASWGLSLYYNDSLVALSLDTGSDFSTSIGSSWVTIGYTVPDGYRPSHHTSGHIYPNLELYVGSNGAIKVRKISGDATTAAKGYVIYPRF